MSYFFDNVKLDPDAPGFLNALENSWKNKTRPLCACSKARPPMYVAKFSDHFAIKRMPGTSHTHHPDCGSYSPPAGVSGLGQVLDSAITHSEEDNQTMLRLDFSLSQSGKRPLIPPPSSEGATEAVSAPRKLTLTGLLHYLWHEADLVKWHPAMEGKRWWGPIYNTLSHAVDGMIAKGNPLAERLYIPRPFRKEIMSELEGQRRSAFSRLQGSKSGAKQLGMVLAEYKTHMPTSRGAKFVFKHITGCGFFADQDLVTRFERVFADSIELVDMTEGAHLIMMATYSISRAGYPELSQIAAMPVTRNWIPFENTNDLALLDHITQEKRSFVRPLRFNLPKSEMIASALLIDTNLPIACFIGDRMPEGASDDMASWLWTGDGQLPPMPIDPEEDAYGKMLDSWEQTRSGG